MTRLRPDGLANLDASSRAAPSRPSALRVLQPQDVLGFDAERRVGLGDHLVGAAEPVEVVDVERAEIDLHGVEHVSASARPAACALVRSMIGIELRHVDLVAGEHAGQLRRPARLGHAPAVDGPVQRVVAAVGAVLDLELEAADRCRAPAPAAAGRSRCRRPDAGELLLQRLGDGEAGQVRRVLRSSNGFSVDEDDAGVASCW